MRADEDVQEPVGLPPCMEAHANVEFLATSLIKQLKEKRGEEVGGDAENVASNESVLIRDAFTPARKLPADESDSEDDIDVKGGERDTADDVGGNGIPIVEQAEKEIDKLDGIDLASLPPEKGKLAGDELAELFFSFEVLSMADKSNALDEDEVKMSSTEEVQ